MPWRFVGRKEQVERIRVALNDHHPGPIVITGERGIGRSALLCRALEYADNERDTLIRPTPSGDAPFATLQTYLPVDFGVHGALNDAIPAAARAIAEQAEGRRLVVALDDAHLADHASVLTLRALSRQGAAILLITRPSAVSSGRRPDPTEPLRYEPGIQTLALPPLGLDEVAAVLADVVHGQMWPATTEALHAATGGNPRLLHDLVVDEGLVDCMVSRDGVWRLGEEREAAGVAAPAGKAAPAGVAVPAGTPVGDATRLATAARRAWQDLALDRAHELCRLALLHGAYEQIAAVWGNVLLLRGRAEDALRFMDGLPSATLVDSPELALARATTLALGLGRTGEACDFLLRAASRTAELRNRLLSYRAWILAVTGSVKAVDALDGVDRSDRETAIFVHAARAAIALGSSRANEAVFHLRRGLATVEGCPGVPPWVPPYLTACLIDAMLLAGRIGEATSIARDFHGGEPGSGWEIAVAFTTLPAAGRQERVAVRKASTV